MTPAASVSVAEHLAAVLAGVRALGPVRVPLQDSLGCVLAEDVVALVDSPGFDNAAMDGYAVRRADVGAATEARPVVLQVVADIPAGSAGAPRLSAGQAARIMTGAQVPHGADAVIPFEQTDSGMTAVSIRQPAAPGGHIRVRGSDAAIGSALLAAGQPITARRLAAAAAAGRGDLLVIPRPRIAVIATGSELAPVGSTLGPGQVHDSNTALIAAAVTEAGGVPVVLGRSPDRPEELLALLAQAPGLADAVVVTGGIGRGAYDVTRAALEPTGAVRFTEVRLQPGRPQAFGHWPGELPLIGLPGKPVATYVSFAAFVEPALRVLRGLPPVQHAPRRVPAASAWRSRPDREQRVAVRLVPRADGVVEAWPVEAGGGTHQLSALAAADALAVIGEGVDAVEVGQLVQVLPLPGQD